MNQKLCYWIYILVCSNGAFYTGFTKNLHLRFKQHLTGKARVKYTRSFKPTTLAQSWQLQDSLGTALKVEQIIKKQPRKIKMTLIENPLELKTLLEKQLNLKLAILPIEPKELQELNSLAQEKENRFQMTLSRMKPQN